MQHGLLRVEQAKKANLPDFPKNLNRYTFLLIWQYINAQSGTVSAAEAAIGTGVSRTTARRYLEYCFERGMVERTLGRPPQTPFSGVRAIGLIVGKRCFHRTCR